MTVAKNENLSKRELGERSGQLREQAVKAQLGACLAACDFADAEIRFGDLHKVPGILEKIHTALQKVDFHIAEPDHVPFGSIEELRNLLEQVKDRLRVIESEVRTRH